MLAVEIDSGVEILGFVAQLLGTTGATGVARTVLDSLVYPKKYEVTKITTGINNKPHETNSMSLKDKYTIKNVTIRPERRCSVILSGVL